jgi:integrase
MVKLRQDRNGKYIARKRLPDDVREEYGRRYKARHEAKFSAPACIGPHAAKQKFREWDAEITARIETIRAERKGEGISLTRQQARALAGEWYHWFIARHPTTDLEKWDALRDQVHEALREAVGDAEWERSDPDECWRQNPKLRKEVYPVLADVGETAQFLAMKCLTINAEGRESFLYWLYDDLAAVLEKLTRLAEGDYGDDGYSKRFPKFEGLDSGETPAQIFEKWVAEKRPAPSTEESWRYPFRAMAAYFPNRSVASITPEEAQDWIASLVSPKRSARTVDSTYLSAANTIFRWAVEHRRIPRNPFEKVKLTVPKATRLREKAFRSDEWRTILKAALAITETDTPGKAARRWIPWLCAYTGARPGEITQLRGADVVQQDGVWALRITPEAGTVKGREPRGVPIHEHLIEQGFLKFVHQRGRGPLFYNPRAERRDGQAPEKSKPRSVQLRQRLAKWVRSLGVGGNGLSPLHGWRHTFKTRAARAGIEASVRDAICGHSPRTVADEYETPSLEDMAAAMKKFHRYDLEELKQ